MLRLPHHAAARFAGEYPVHGDRNLGGQEMDQVVTVNPDVTRSDEQWERGMNGIRT
jgi:hypothetical protein